MSLKIHFSKKYSIASSPREASGFFRILPYCFKDIFCCVGKELFYAHIPNKDTITIFVVSKPTKFNYRKMSTKACLWFTSIRHFYILNAPFTLCYFPVLRLTLFFNSFYEFPFIFGASICHSGEIIKYKERIFLMVGGGY